MSSFPLANSRYATIRDHDGIKKKTTVEDVMPIATGHEREEIEADLQGRSLSEMDYPVGPFATKVLVLPSMWQIRKKVHPQRFRLGVINEGARMAGVARIIGVNLNAMRFVLSKTIWS